MSTDTQPQGTAPMTFPPDLLVLDWSTGGVHPAVDLAVDRIRRGGGTVAFRNARISALALQYDLRESGLGPAPAPAPAPDATDQLVRALDRQFALETGRRVEERERRDEDRRRHDRVSDQDSSAKKAYLETFELLYGDTRYPVGDARRGGILTTYSVAEAQTQIIWWAEKGELVIEDVLLFAHLIWAAEKETYAAIVLRYRDLPSRIRAHNVVVTEAMESEHKLLHPQFKSRNLGKIVGCPFPLLPPVTPEFIRLNQDILDSVPEHDQASVSGGGPPTKGTRLPTAYKHATSVGSSFRVSFRAPVRGGEPYFFVEGPDSGGRHAVDMAPASDAVAALQAQVKTQRADIDRLVKAQKEASHFGARQPPAPAPGKGKGPRDPPQLHQPQPVGQPAPQPQLQQQQQPWGGPSRRQGRGKASGGDAGETLDNSGLEPEDSVRASWRVSQPPQGDFQ
jgi:hypothetical protein